MKIAIASSGLGRVLRGIETSCLELARGLHERGVDVTLFAAGEIEPRRHGDTEEREGLSGLCASARDLPVIVLDSLSRDSRAARVLGRLTPWWGLKNEYAWEQFSFWLKLWPKLRRGHFDLLYVRDPMLAFWCKRFRRFGLLKTLEILGYGIPSGIEFLKQFDRIQFLTPWHLGEAVMALRAKKEDRSGPGTSPVATEDIVGSPSGGNSLGEGGFTGSPAFLSTPGDPDGGKPESWTVIPNFVDTERFAPAKSKEERGKRRERFDVPADAFVIGTVAAVRKPHKRIDYLIREFAAFANRERQLPEGDESPNSRIPESSNQRINACPPFLLVCGARTEESDELMQLADKLAPGRVKFLFDVPGEQMPDIYRAMDLFVLTSLWETFGRCIIEAMAAELPVIVSDHPSIQWIIGVRGQESDGRERTTDDRQQTRDYRQQITENHARTIQAASESSNSQIFESSSDQGTTDHRPPTTDHGKEDTCAFGGHYSPHSCREAAGAAIDMSKDGMLAAFLAGITPEWIGARGKAARKWVEATFSKKVVAEQYIQYCGSIAGNRGKDLPANHAK